MTVYRLRSVLCIIKCFKPRSCAARMMGFCHEEAPCAPRNLYSWTQYVTHLPLNKIFRMMLFMSPLPLENVPLCYQKICMRDLADHHSKASIQARLVKRKVCSISDASSCETGQTCPKANSLLPSSLNRQSWGRGATWRSCTVIFKLVSGLTSVTLVVLSTVNI